ncbi:MAG: electron transport complex subunit RsxE [Deltaproteobacteria bacterium]|nr:electron transport complex subunit RsxE [Deltaproteobacteria bacterium]
MSENQETSSALSPAEQIAAISGPFRGSKQTTLSGLIDDGVFGKNPVFVLALSLCPAVAVTNSVQTSLAMGLSVWFVLSFSNLFTSIFRNYINPKVRMPAYILIIATLVTMCELFMSAFFPVLYQALGVYLKLIVVFAIILARAEVFASKNKPIPAFFDGFGMGLGFLIAMLVIGVPREVVGSGSFWGRPIFGEGYQPILMIILAPGGFITIGLFIGLFRSIGAARERARAAARLEGAGDAMEVKRV